MFVYRIRLGADGPPPATGTNGGQTGGVDLPVLDPLQAVEPKQMMFAEPRIDRAKLFAVARPGDAANVYAGSEGPDIGSGLLRPRMGQE